MKIGICDDEKQFIDALCPILKQWAKAHNIKLTLYLFTNGDDLIDAHQNECIDLIILDILMPLLNGMDTARELRDNDCFVPIIFLSSSKEFAVDSYEIKALSYLTKPIDETRLNCVLDDFLKRFCPRNTFTAQTAFGFCKIAIDDVDYLEAQNKQVLVHMSDGRTIEIRELFSKCVEVFSPSSGFFRCHRSYIVNLDNVEQFTKTQLSTTYNAKVPISRNSYAAFKEAYFNRMFEESTANNSHK